MKGKPKVSIIMTVYNEEEYIRESVTSVLNQTYKDFELVVVNDGSTDRTQEILENEFNDRRVKVFSQKIEGELEP